MRICHMTSVHNSDDIRIFQKECISLAKDKENQVFLVAPGDERTEKNVKVVGIGKTSGGRIKRILSVSRKIYKKAIEIDAEIYHLHDPELLLYAKKLKRKGKIVIFDSHESYPDQIKNKYYLPDFLRTTLSKLYYQYETNISRIIDAVIFPCTINGKHPFEGRARVTEFINNLPIIEEYSDRVDYTGNKKTVCCAGGLTYDRGLEVLIDASHKIGAKVILAGNITPEEYADKIIHKESYSSVEFRGRCTHDEVIKIYKNSTVGSSTILPVGQYPKAENLPTKVYEYMAMGMPFIMSDFGYCRKFRNKYDCCILVDTTDVNSVAEGLTFLFDNPEEAIKMGKRGRQAAEQEFNWSIEEKKLINLYNKLYQE